MCLVSLGSVDEDSLCCLAASSETVTVASIAGIHCYTALQEPWLRSIATKLIVHAQSHLPMLHASQPMLWVNAIMRTAAGCQDMARLQLMLRLNDCLCLVDQMLLFCEDEHLLLLYKPACTVFH